MKTIPILYENDEIYVIDKPAGVAVQGGVHIAHPLDTTLSVQTGNKVYLVHRLDQDTAGLMVVAKTPAAAAKWTKLISGKFVRKEYEACCIGTLPEKKGTIRTDVIERGDEKPAVTRYEVEKIRCAECGGQQLPVTLVRLALETGRMHQIRIHLATLGCPVAGDDQHGNFRNNKLIRSAFGAKKLMLAAVHLVIPVDGKEKAFEIPLPEHMVVFWDACTE
jgi:23S rRNA pseudouridine955/2504/2580 synthase